MNTENICKFLATAYSDEKLAALLAHTEEGKLRFNSCCCLTGIPTADHALRGQIDWIWSADTPAHLTAARELPFADKAEDEYFFLGITDEQRRSVLLPLIHAEIARRDSENWKAAQEEPVEMMERMAK